MGKVNSCVALLATSAKNCPTLMIGAKKGTIIDPAAYIQSMTPTVGIVI